MSTGGRERSSLFTGLLLILLGSLLLLHRFHPELEITRLATRYWPVLLILWGLAKLIDHRAATRSGEKNPPFLAGGEAALIALIVLVLLAMWVADIIPSHIHSGRDLRIELFSKRYSDSRQLPPAEMPAGALLKIEAGQGHVTVHGGEGSQLHVGSSVAVAASSEAAARERAKNIQVVLEQSGNGFVLRTVNQESSDKSDVDLDVEVPRKTNVQASCARCDISIADISGAAVASSQEGDIDIHDTESDVAATAGNGDVRISGAKGSVRVAGKGNQVEVSDVGGDAEIAGDFYGPIRVRNVKRNTHFASMSSDITLSRLTGQLQLDSGDIEISDVAGPGKLATRNKDIEIENLAGPLDVAGSHGDISVRFSQPPREDIRIANDTGEVDLTLPGQSAFEISAVSRFGEIESDFEDPSLRLANEKDTGVLNGKFGAHGPRISIQTSYGTVYLRKSS